MRILLVTALMFLVSCTKEVDGEKVTATETWQFYCSYETVDKRAMFVANCIKNANPKSDEEPEDWIAECGRTAKDIYCFWGNQFQAKKHYERMKQTLQEEL